MSPQIFTIVADYSIYILNSTLAADGNQDCTCVPHFGVSLAYDILKTKIVKAHFEGMASFFRLSVFDREYVGQTESP